MYCMSMCVCVASIFNALTCLFWRTHHTHFLVCSVAVVVVISFFQFSHVLHIWVFGSVFFWFDNFCRSTNRSNCNRTVSSFDDIRQVHDISYGIRFGLVWTQVEKKLLFDIMYRIVCCESNQNEMENKEQTNRKTKKKSTPTHAHGVAVAWFFDASTNRQLYFIAKRTSSKNNGLLRFFFF